MPLTPPKLSERRTSSENCCEVPVCLRSCCEEKKLGASDRGNSNSNFPMNGVIGPKNFPMTGSCASWTCCRWVYINATCKCSWRRKTLRRLNKCLHGGTQVKYNCHSTWVTICKLEVQIKGSLEKVPPISKQNIAGEAYCDASGREFSYLDLCNSLQRRALELGKTMASWCLGCSDMETH